MVEELSMKPASQANLWLRVLVLLEVSLLALLIPVARVGFKYFAPDETISSASR
jgi:hypothetical protein